MAIHWRHPGHSSTSAGLAEVGENGTTLIFHLTVKLNERPLRSKFKWLACDLVKGKQLKLLLITLVSSFSAAIIPWRAFPARDTVILVRLLFVVLSVSLRNQAKPSLVPRPHFLY